MTKIKKGDLIELDFIGTFKETREQQSLKNNFFDNELEIIFSKSIIGKDSCNTYHVKIENSGNFNAKNCIKKVYLTGFTSSK